MTLGQIMTYEAAVGSKDFSSAIWMFDGDGIPYRTLPGTHPNRGSFFTRGSSKDRYAKYTRTRPPIGQYGPAAAGKFERRRASCRGRSRPSAGSDPFGALYYGSTSPRARKAPIFWPPTACRSTSCGPRLPVPQDVVDFHQIARRNLRRRTESRTRQCRTLVINECGHRSAAACRAAL